MTPTESLEIVKKIAVSAGELLSGYFGNLSVIEEKEDSSLVTEADKNSENLIIDSILLHFPSSKILSEETGITISNQEYEMEWFIDPLDGTNNFIRKIPFFCVSIAMAIKGELKLGVIYAPLLQQMFSATKGGGAYLNSAPIQVSNTSSLQHSVVGVSRFFSEEYQEQLRFSQLARMFSSVRAVRSMGSAALEMAYVANGNFDLYIGKGIQAWDSAAGELLVREAGGNVLQFNGDDHFPGASSCVACNSIICSELLGFLANASKAEN